MNHMKEVAQMLGVKIGEEFELKKDIGDIYRFKLTPDGLVAFSPITEDWHEGNKLLVDLLLGSNEIVKIPILDRVEKRYLSNIINPWRNCVKYISKCGLSTCEYIAIVYCDKLTEKEYSMFFPSFGKGEMYKGMETNKDYTLEELGL